MKTITMHLLLQHECLLPVSLFFPTFEKVSSEVTGARYILKIKKQFAIFFLFSSSTNTFWGPISASFVRCPFSCGSCS